MNEMQVVYLLYGMVVREWFVSHHTMDEFDQSRLWNFSLHQVQMYNDGIRDSRMHDTTLVLMENTKRL